MQLQIQPTSIRPTRGDMNSQAADKGPHEVQINECAVATQPQHICTFQSMASVHSNSDIEFSSIRQELTPSSRK